MENTIANTTANTTTARYNEDFIKILDELYSILSRQGEPFRAKAYQKAQETIITFKDDITDPVKQLKGLPGIGETILAKFEEYVKTGTLAILEKERNNPINLFTQIHGIGPKKAQELVGLGITTIDQLRYMCECKNDNSVKLNDKQSLGLKYFEDISKRILRPEIDDFYVLFNIIFDEYAPPASKFDIVGSYRRGLSDSGDIDIIITNENNDSSVLNTILDVLVSEGIILEFLSRGKIKSMVIANLNPDTSNISDTSDTSDKSKNPARRIDFLYSPPDEFAFAHLYFTGSKLFNTIVRQKALDMGYTLNEHGISPMVKGIKGDTLDKCFPDEKSILNFLELQYVEPEKRIDYKGVILLKNEEPSLNPQLNKTGVKNPSLKNKTLKRCRVTSINDYIEKFKNEGISVLKMMTEKELTNLLSMANNAYYNNTESIMNDNLYDILREYTLEKYPNNTIAKDGHASSDLSIEKNKVKLPFELWSMDKIKPDGNIVKKWTQKFMGPYIISCKLDGISALYVSGKKSSDAKLYTRGNGRYGQDISHLIPYLIKNNGIKFDPLFVLRGEIIIKKEVFVKKYASKFANPRNFVAGIVNKKTIDPKVVKDIDFVPYEVIEPVIKPSEQMKFIKDKWIFSSVKYTSLSVISNEILSELLLLWREEYAYEIDGIIIVNDEIYPRPTKNPEYAFAFKMILSEQVTEAKVVDVLWTPSKDGYLKPRVQIEPIVLSGVTIEYATGFNAKFINDNKIGIGSIISIIRSGDVIPHILSVITPSEKAKMPLNEYKWNETGVDIILENKEDNSIVKEKNITGFFKGIGVDGLGSGNIARIIDAGFDTIPKIIDMKHADFLGVEGFKDRLATKIYTNIHTQIDKASLALLMASSNIFGRGFGERRFTSILKMYPNILLLKDVNNDEKIKMLLIVEGLARKTAEKFIEKIPAFVSFMNDSGLDINTYISAFTESMSENVVGDSSLLKLSLQNKKIVMTGFRNKELEEKIKSLGGEISGSVTKNTFAVLIKDKNGLDEITSKMEQAHKLDIPIIPYLDFMKKYINLNDGLI